MNIANLVRRTSQFYSLLQKSNSALVANRYSSSSSASSSSSPTSSSSNGERGNGLLVVTEDAAKQKGKRSPPPPPPIVVPLPLWAAFLGMFGTDTWKRLDDDPIKDKMKWAMLHRKYGRYGEAIEVLQQALLDVQQSGKEMHVTRVYDEMANTYLEADQLEKADELFRLVVHRLITIHRKSESSPEFIGISLKLANMFARRGDPQSADIGYRHCLSQQVQQVDHAMAQFHVDQGALVETFHPVEERGTEYIEPFALMGMCLSEYAYFLMDFYADTRSDEAQEYINEALKLSYKLFGLNSFHAVNIMSTFAAKCILKNHFDTARKYLELGLDRVLLLPECESVSDEAILLSYYCAYAEALFHTGEPEKAADIADRAVQLATGHQDQAVRNYVHDFAKQMRRGALRRELSRGGGGNGTGKAEGNNNNKQKKRTEKRPSWL